MRGEGATPAGANRLQDAFLAAALGQLITMYLANGVRLEGAIIAEDKYSLLLVRGRAMQLVLKHAVSTVVPLDAVLIPAAERSAAEPT